MTRDADRSSSACSSSEEPHELPAPGNPSWCRGYMNAAFPLDLRRSSGRTSDCAAAFGDAGGGGGTDGDTAAYASIAAAGVVIGAERHSGVGTDELRACSHNAGSSAWVPRDLPGCRLLDFFSTSNSSFSSSLSSSSSSSAGGAASRRAAASSVSCCSILSDWATFARLSSSGGMFSFGELLLQVREQRSNVWWLCGCGFVVVACARGGREGEEREEE